VGYGEVNAQVSGKFWDRLPKWAQVVLRFLVVLTWPLWFLPYAVYFLASIMGAGSVFEWVLTGEWKDSGY
jgi:hypothetical protein